MTTVQLRFLSGRYHGTIWGRHVNEGLPEWPPSPYRLLRTLYDAWQRKCDHLPEVNVRGLFEQLASMAPVFHVPVVTASHTRSYLSSNTEDPKDKSLIFDAFVVMPQNVPCYVQWDVTLTTEHRKAFEELLAAVNYLGRSESWVQAELKEAPQPGLLLCSSGSDASGEAISVACPVAASEYADRQAWLKALTYSSSDMLKERRSDPPAMKNVTYRRSQDSVRTWLSPKQAQRTMPISGIKLAFDGRVLPVATQTLSVAERIRAALIRNAPDPTPSSISGKDAESQPLKGHQHLFILPQQNRQGRINEVLLFLHSHQLGLEELEAILRLNKLHPFQHVNQPIDAHDKEALRVAVTWAGNSNSGEFRPRSREVISSTPFLTARMWRKGRGSIDDFVRNEVLLECRNHGLPEPLEIIREEQLRGIYPAIRYKRSRKEDSPRVGYAFRIVFTQDVPTPFSLGYACHFGMGQFHSVKSRG